MTLLRELTDAALEACEGDLVKALGVAAYRFLRIGGTVCNVEDLAPVEIAALEAARERLEAEQFLRLSLALRDPLAASAVLDGGEAARRSVMRASLSRAVQEVIRA